MFKGSVLYFGQFNPFYYSFLPLLSHPQLFNSFQYILLYPLPAQMLFYEAQQCKEVTSLCWEAEGEELFEQGMFAWSFLSQLTLFSFIFILDEHMLTVHIIVSTGIFSHMHMACTNLIQPSFRFLLSFIKFIFCYSRAQTQVLLHARQETADLHPCRQALLFHCSFTFFGSIVI
jgi:hypothetical protein